MHNSGHRTSKQYDLYLVRLLLNQRNRPFWPAHQNNTTVWWESRSRWLNKEKQTIVTLHWQCLGLGLSFYFIKLKIKALNFHTNKFLFKQSIRTIIGSLFRKNPRQNSSLIQSRTKENNTTVCWESRSLVAHSETAVGSGWSQLAREA